MERPAHPPNGHGTWSLAQPANGWPLVGRAGILDHASELLGGQGRMSVALVGEPGVGKTTVARAVVEQVAGANHVVELQGLAGSATVPFAALSNLLISMDDVEANGPVAVLRAVAARLEDESQGRPTVVVVDDAHQIDESSAMVLCRLALARRAQLLLTARPAPGLPDALGALIGANLLERLDIDPLTESEVAAAIALALQGPVSLATTRHICHAADGNPLYVREMLRAGMRNGDLVRRDGVWVWAGADPPAGRHLSDLVATELGRRTQREREALELVALAEPVPVATLLTQIAPDALDVLERERLVVVNETSPPSVSLAHPIYGEAVRAVVPAGRRMELHRRFLAEVHDPGERSPVAVLRTVAWALDCGVDVEPERIVHAARLANRLHDYVFASRVARAALGSERDHDARMELAWALRFRGRVGDALIVLEGTEPPTSEQVVDAELLKATMLQFGLDRIDDALARLDAAEAAASTVQALRRVTEYRLMHLVYAGRNAEAGKIAAELGFEDDVPESSRALCGAAVAMRWAACGRTEQAVTLLTQVLTDAQQRSERTAWALEEAVSAMVAVCLLRGAMPTEPLEESKALAMADPTVRFDADLEQTALGWSLLNAGRAADAERELGVAVAGFSAYDVSGFQAGALALAAEAAVVAGEHERARLLARQAERTPWRSARVMTAQVRRALLWPLASERGFEAAIAAAHELATVCIAEGELGSAAHVLHDAVRLGDDHAAKRLVELGEVVDSPRALASRAHALALIDGDPEALERAAGRFAQSGLNLHAAEAYADAAVANRERGRTDSARRCTATMKRLLAGLGTVSTPRLLQAASVQPLTRRELEIAALAKRMLTNAEIAAAIGLGQRTVEGHLHRLYGKLGINSREELDSVLP